MFKKILGHKFIFQMLLFGGAFAVAMVVFLRPSAEELAQRHQREGQIIAALPVPRPPHLIVTLAAAWCGICHGQFKALQQKYRTHDFSQGDYQWWALNIDPAYEDNLKLWWARENLSLKLLLPGRSVTSVLQDFPSLAIPLHLLIEENTWREISYRELKQLGKSVWGKKAQNN